MDKIMAEIISDVLVNLASGWIGASIIFSITSKFPRKINVRILIFNIFFATVSLVIVFLLKTNI
ncbi:MAG: hypothetical protein Q7S14_02930 [bacterium]|nr:hypothetical protein [bacterium]